MEAKKSPRFGSVGKYNRENMLFQVEIVDRLFESIILVHRDDVLEAQLFCGLSSDFQSTDDLPPIDTIK